MARMYNMAQDWTYDLFAEDARLYKATPIKGVHPSKDASDRERFMTWLKGFVRDFKARWEDEHEGHLYDRYDGWIGDEFSRELGKTFFSDYYKDVYGQRPHLPAWFYAHAVDLPHSEDTIRIFCSYPVEDAVSNARNNRLILESM